MCMCGYVRVSASTWGGEKHQTPLELAPEAIMSPLIVNTRDQAQVLRTSITSPNL